MSLVPLEELEFIGSNADVREVATCAHKCLIVCERKPEAVDFAVRPPRPVVGIGADVAISTDQPAEISAAVFGGFVNRSSNSAESHQCAGPGQMRGTRPTAPGPR